MRIVYPRMVYLGGDTSAKGYRVPNAKVEALVAADGYYPAGEGPQPKAAPAKAVAPAKKAPVKRKAAKRTR